jgi:hypothetical protein
LETEEQTLEREQNVRDVLEALGEYKCDARISVETVPAVVNIKTLKDNLLHTSSPLRGQWVWRRVSKRKRVFLASLLSSISQKRIAGLKN